MSSIGYSPAISPQVGEIGAVRTVGSSDPGAAPQSSAPTRSAMAAPNVPVAVGAALDPGAAPVDQDRVATIKKAIADNSYPVVPTKIGDAMIAAGMLLRMAK